MERFLALPAGPLVSSRDDRDDLPGFRKLDKILLAFYGCSNWIVPESPIETVRISVDTPLCRYAINIEAIDNARYVTSENIPCKYSAAYPNNRR